MRFLAGTTIISACILAVSCAVPNAYHEPDASESAAYIKLKQDDMVGKVLKSAVYMPTYGLNLNRIDDKFFSSRWGNKVIRVSPGTHAIAVQCSLNNQVTGEKIFNINAKPGKVYTISYPTDLKGYFYYTGGCSMLKVS